MTKLELIMKIKEEVVKQLDARLLEMTYYMEWLNIVPVLEKDGNIGMYAGYRDLNKASSKDDFSLQALMSSWIVLPDMFNFLSWKASRATIKSGWLQRNGRKLLL